MEVFVEERIAREERILPVVIDACIAEAHRLSSAVASHHQLNPAIAAMADELELMERMAARNPDNRAMSAAVAEQRQRIEALQRDAKPEIDPRFYKALQDPLFFSDATTDEQRVIFQAVLRAVAVGVHGDPIEPRPRSS